MLDAVKAKGRKDAQWTGDAAQWSLPRTLHAAIGKTLNTGEHDLSKRRDQLLIFPDRLTIKPASRGLVEVLRGMVGREVHQVDRYIEE